VLKIKKNLGYNFAFVKLTFLKYCTYINDYLPLNIVLTWCLYMLEKCQTENGVNISSVNLLYGFFKSINCKIFGNLIVTMFLKNSDTMCIYFAGNNWIMFTKFALSIIDTIYFWLDDTGTRDFLDQYLKHHAVALESTHYIGFIGNSCRLVSRRIWMERNNNVFAVCIKWDIFTTYTLYTYFLLFFILSVLILFKLLPRVFN